jgi:hypothetical protein
MFIAEILFNLVRSVGAACKSMMAGAHSAPLERGNNFHPEL